MRSKSTKTVRFACTNSIPTNARHSDSRQTNGSQRRKLRSSAQRDRVNTLAFVGVLNSFLDSRRITSEGRISKRSGPKVPAFATVSCSSKNTESKAASSATTDVSVRHPASVSVSTSGAQDHSSASHLDGREPDAFNLKGLCEALTD
ncbi:hypothetical protein GYMLUDRAFT_95907 [Collybiopsis luxurians FD-317 M1]|uniref:Uncharacterized protein n=1 Tax=Collybiopsis luxurians FD-317 M1 TaxID=944289 RepID=A0A0D0CJ43_9AGAR|nr:hypothetical protein GYMLUDRAFT_95907 [Collybiopsis luxurians FD-317 M1]